MINKFVNKAILNIFARVFEKKDQKWQVLSESKIFLDADSLPLVVERCMYCAAGVR